MARAKKRTKKASVRKPDTHHQPLRMLVTLNVPGNAPGLEAMRTFGIDVAKMTPLVRQAFGLSLRDMMQSEFFADGSNVVVESVHVLAMPSTKPTRKRGK